MSRHSQSERTQEVEGTAGVAMPFNVAGRIQNLAVVLPVLSAANLRKVMPAKHKDAEESNEGKNRTLCGEMCSSRAKSTMMALNLASLLTTVRPPSLLPSENQSKRSINQHELISL